MRGKENLVICGARCEYQNKNTCCRTNFGQPIPITIGVDGKCTQFEYKGDAGTSLAKD